MLKIAISKYGVQLLSRLTYLTRKRTLIATTRIQHTFEHLTPLERVVLWVLISFFSISAFILVLQVRNEATVRVPVYGGVVNEGVIGAPRLINPLLAPSDTDRDLVALVYSGLMRPNTDGTLIPDLAKRYSISPDGLIYTFVLKDDIYFHDGTPVTADDIVFTIQRAQDPSIKSPLRADWDGVTVKKINDREVQFILKRPYAPFLENTTMGILPRHLWLNVLPQEFALSTFNTQPIGSGPYMLKHINYDSTGIPTRYELRAFSKFALGRPYINTFFIRFYANEGALINAYQSGIITSMSAISSTQLNQHLRGDSRILRLAFPRIFALFFNQNKNHVLASKSVRTALNTLVDKQDIVQSVLNGYGTAINSPIPPKTVKGQYIFASSQETTAQRQDKARSVLLRDGWKYDTTANQWSKKKEVLALSIATANTPELKKAAELTKKAWEDFGIPTKINIFETGDLNQNVIRPREYDVLLFGEVIGRNLDLFAFWHSSQKDDPGLNIALYTNTKVDSLLSKARTKSNIPERDALYVKAEDEIRSDIPAIFLYAPDFLYVVPKGLTGIATTLVATPSERFAQVYQWHTQTERVWNFLTRKHLFK